MTSILNPRPPPSFLNSLKQQSRVKILIVVEGQNDIEFLKRISQILHHDDPKLLSLGTMERNGELIFFAQCGSPTFTWCDRLAPLRLSEFHLYDREASPETETREKLIRSINHRPKCFGRLTRKRAIENYLHPKALLPSSGVTIPFSSDDHVPCLVSRTLWEQSQRSQPWEILSRRTKNRYQNRVKRWLNTKVVDAMTIELLEESDPDNDIRGWLEEIDQLAQL